MWTNSDAETGMGSRLRSFCINEETRRPLCARALNLHLLPRTSSTIDSPPLFRGQDQQQVPPWQARPEDVVDYFPGIDGLATSRLPGCHTMRVLPSWNGMWHASSDAAGTTGPEMKMAYTIKDLGNSTHISSERKRPDLLYCLPAITQHYRCLVSPNHDDHACTQLQRGLCDHPRQLGYVEALNQAI